MIYLTELEMINAIVAHLTTYQSQTKSDDALIIIKALICLRDRVAPTVEESVILKDWQDIVTPFKNLINGAVYSEIEAFDIFGKFLAKYYERTNSDLIGAFLSDLQHEEYGYTADPAAAKDWQKSLKKVKEVG